MLQAQDGKPHLLKLHDQPSDAAEIEWFEDLKLAHLAGVRLAQFLEIQSQLQRLQWLDHRL